MVTVSAKDFEFDMPEAIPSGWNAFRLVNESNEQEHFILFARIPDDRTFAEYRSEVFNPFMDVFDRYSAAELTLSNYEIETSGQLTAGTRTVAVHVTDTPEGMLPHDINLFRLESETTTVEEIVAWMDWMDLGQFRAPGPGISIGGVEHLPAGATGYKTVDLEPGRYAWVSQGYGARGMVEEFTVE